MLRRPPISTLSYTTLFRSTAICAGHVIEVVNPGRWTTIQDRGRPGRERFGIPPGGAADWFAAAVANRLRSEEHTSELQSPMYLVCRLLLEKKKNDYTYNHY